MFKTNKQKAIIELNKQLVEKKSQIGDSMYNDFLVQNIQEVKEIQEALDYLEDLDL